jgi:hypothetical protein
MDATATRPCGMPVPGGRADFLAVLDATRTLPISALNASFSAAISMERDYDLGSLVVVRVKSFHADASFQRNPIWPVRNHRPAWRWRHGRSLSSARYAAQSRSCHKSSPRPENLWVNRRASASRLGEEPSEFPASGLRSLLLRRIGVMNQRISDPPSSVQISQTSLLLWPANNHFVK